MLLFLFYCFLAYLLYNLVFRFILPVYRATRQVKKGFRDMQDRMQQHAQQQNNYQGATNGSPANKGGRAGEYIEFEEVKD